MNAHGFMRGIQLSVEKPKFARCTITFVTLNRQWIMRENLDLSQEDGEGIHLHGLRLSGHSKEF